MKSEINRQFVMAQYKKIIKKNSLMTMTSEGTNTNIA